MVFPIPTGKVPAGYEDIYGRIFIAIHKSVTKDGYLPFEVVYLHLFGNQREVQIGDAISQVANVLATEFIPNLPFSLDSVERVTGYKTQQELNNSKPWTMNGGSMWFIGLGDGIFLNDSFINSISESAIDGHLESILMQWYLITKPEPVVSAIPAAKVWAVNIIGLPKIALYWLCAGILSSHLFNLMSDTHAAWLYAALTGKVILPGFDPTKFAFYNKYSKLIEIDELQTLNYGYLLAKKTHEKWRFKYTTDVSDYIKTDVYTSLSSPDAKPIMKFVDEYLEAASRDREEKIVGVHTKKVLTANGLAVNLYDDSKATFTPDNSKVGTRGFIFSIEIHSLFTYIYTRGNSLNSLNSPPFSLHYPSLFHFSDFDIIDRLIGGYSDEKVKEFTKLGKFDDRDDFLKMVTDAFMDNRWVASVSRKCVNGYLPHYIMREERDVVLEEAKREGSTSAFLVYGPKNKIYSGKCYQVDELMASFDDYPTGFEFRNPDWDPEIKRVDMYTGAGVSKFMNTKQVTSLLKYLRRIEAKHAGRPLPPPPITQMVELKEKMEDGLNTDRRLIAALSTLQKQTEWGARWYFASIKFFSWLFLFSMWVRFWKGPGHPYPATWNEQNPDTCLYKQRDENVEIELKVYDLLMKYMEEEAQMSQLIKNLPYIYHSWFTGESKVPLPSVAREITGAYTIGEVMDKIKAGNFCMAQATDILSGTAFVYLTRGLGVKIEDERHGIHVIEGVNGNLVKAMKDTEMMETIATKAREKELLELGLPLDEVHNHGATILGLLSPLFVQEPLDFSSITVSNHLPFDLQRMEMGMFGM